MSVHVYTCTRVHICVCSHAGSGSPGLRVPLPSLALCLRLLFAPGVTSQAQVFVNSWLGGLQTMQAVHT